MVKAILGQKVGMTQIFDGNGNVIGVTVVRVPNAVILQRKDYDKYTALQLGCFYVDDNKKSKLKEPVLGYFNKLGIRPCKIIKEVPLGEGVNKEEAVSGKTVGIEIFEKGELVDVRAKNKGRGFQGGMKRHNWKGQPASHGSMTHRRIGSAGSNTYPGRVLRGHRMPGHMGNHYCTIKNLEIVDIDKEKELLFIKGSLPGGVNNILLIKKK